MAVRAHVRGTLAGIAGRVRPAHQEPPRPAWSLGGLTLAQLASRVADAFSRDRVLERAGALSYFFLGSLFPGLVFLACVFGLMPVQGLMDRLLGYIEPVVPAGIAELIRRVLGEVVAGASGGLLSIGAIGALWTASVGMASMMSALNDAYGVEDHRPWWTRRLVAIALTIGFSVFVALALLLLVVGPPVAHLIAAWVGLGHAFTVLWELASWPIVVASAMTAVGLVYYLAPARAQRWRWLTPGSVLAVSCWIALSLVLRLYVGWFNSFNKTYGSIGGVVMLLTWLYVGSIALLVGAEVDSEIGRAAADRNERTRHRDHAA